METFLRLEFKGEANGAAPIGGVSVVRYSRGLHHGVIPAIYADSFSEPPWPADWDQFPEFDPAGVFLAAAGETGAPVGYVVSFRRKDYGYISVAAVKPEWRNRGVASALIKAAIVYLRSLGLAVVKIDVDEKKPRALNLYRKLGFLDVSAQQDCGGG